MPQSVAGTLVGAQAVGVGAAVYLAHGQGFQEWEVVAMGAGIGAVAAFIAECIRWFKPTGAAAPNPEESNI